MSDAIFTGAWNKNGEYTFVSSMHEFINKINSNGTSEKNINPYEIIFDDTGMGVSMPKNLEELLAIVGPEPEYITYDVYANATGRVSNHDCWQTNELIVNGFFSNNSNKSSVSVTKTNDTPNDGGPIAPCWTNKKTHAGTCWAKLYQGKDLLTKITTDNKWVSGGNCAFFIKGGWDEAKVSLLIFVTVSAKKYCTLPDTENISNDFCFNSMAKYFQQEGINVDDTRYIENYCAKKFPDADLYTLKVENKIDNKDLNICACNMPLTAYGKFLSRARAEEKTIQKKCYLGNCLDSSFKPEVLNKCPPSQCVNMIEINRSAITVDDLNINQRAECINSTNIDGTPYVPKDDDKPKSNILLIIGISIMIIFILGLVGLLIWTL